jgi:hypothetical protein
MVSIVFARRVLVCLVLGGVAACAQSTLPPMSPTVAERAPHLASVDFADGRLAVSADNSSLNQILRDVARRTGIRITGRVIDQQVFGAYGPAAPAKVLETLLEGTESNVLFIEASADAHEELILTPRQGGPTPPNPGAPVLSDEAHSSEGAGSPSAYQQASVDSPAPPPSAQRAEDSNSGTVPAASAATQTDSSTQAQSPSPELQPAKSTANTQ